MNSLVLTLDPKLQGGILSMQRMMASAHVRLGLDPCIGFARSGRKSRFDLRVREELVGTQRAVDFGYLPSIEYLNYLAPAVAMRSRLASYPVIQLVGGSHAASLVPILARRPFVSWVATPYGDEIASRSASAQPSLSVRINHRLLPVNEAVERWTYRFPGKVFALSSYTAGRLATLTGLPLARFDVLRMPVDIKTFPAEGPRWERAPGRYVVTASRVDDERKNVASLVRSFARIGARHPDVSLVVAGEVAPDSRVTQLASELGVRDRVHFVGALRGPELAAAFRSAEVYVMTSRQEGLGIVVLEAQASGLPVVIMRCGGSDELVDEGRTGWLIDQGDEDAFARRLSEVLDEEPLRRRVGRAAREAAVRASSLDAFDRALGSAYAEVFAGFSARELAPAYASSGA